MSEYKPIILINLCTRSTDDMFYIRRGYLEALKNAGGIPVGLSRTRESAAHREPSLWPPVNDESVKHRSTQNQELGTHHP